HLSAMALQNGATPREVLEADVKHVREERMAMVLEALHRQDSDVYWPATRALTAARPEFDEHPPEEVGAELAQEHGLDVDQYRDDLEDPATAEAVARDTKLARNLGITGRSTVVFNGEKIGGMRLELRSIVDLVESHLDSLEQLRDSGVEETRLYRAAVDRQLLDDGTLPEVERTPWKLADWSLPDIRRVELRDDDPARGPENAPVTIVEIAELEDCYVCSLQSAALKYGLEEYSDETRVVFKYSPRAHESSSRTLAAAHRQERFWDAYSMLMDSDRHQYPPKKVSPEAVADELELEKERFQQNLRADETAEMIEQSVDDVRGAGIRVAPSLIVNGLELYDPDPRQLKAVVEKQLEIARRIRDQQGLSGDELHAALIEYNEENTEDVWLVR
ncbi:MAG: DsbA family protein, partial [Halodesulfurarchaeum sp.]